MELKPSLIVVDDFCEHAEGVRQSALASGFGRWSPNKGEVGSSIYDGMNYEAAHGIMLRSVSNAFGGARVFPNSMFCRISTPKMERGYIHSDRERGEWTCIVYLSEHGEEDCGTAFYRHRATGLLEMPEFSELADPKHAQLKHDMVHGEEETWAQTHFVRAAFNRAVIFHAPLFHSRIPLLGIGEESEPEHARMVWATHFSLG